MCGIVGAYDPAGGRACATPTLVAMRDRMVHRGPDGGGVWREPRGRCALGHRRLSIIDLSSAAAQPMTNGAGTVVLVFNGEIYNHAALRRELEQTGKYRWVTDHSDTEVLLHAFEEWGIACVERLIGMFAFAIFDGRDPQRPALHLARDRLGKKPLYFSRTARGEWLFASEIRALFAHPDISPEMDRAAFWHYLTFIVTPAPMTLFRGVFKLPAGHVMTIGPDGSASARQYWDCVPDRDRMYRAEDLSEDEAVAELTRRLRTAIERRMVSDVPFGVLLSGGVDSSLNVALMSELMDRPVTTFTIGYQGEEDTNEFRFARRVAERYRTDHHETLIDHRDAQEFLPLLVQLQDEPIADNVCIPLYFLARLVRERGTTVVQVGEGADENFLGYWWCEHYRKKQVEVYDPAARGARTGLLDRLFGTAFKAATGRPPEDEEIARRARAGQELFWGGAACWWGGMRTRLTPDTRPFAQSVDCPVPGLLPPGFAQPDSHGVVRHYLAQLDGRLAHPEVLQKITYLELKLRLPEHLLMRVDKLTMAHSIEARVPFLDPDVVDFAARLPLGYKLKDGVGKYLLKRAAEPYLDRDMVYRTKQGFGAPMESWFREPDFARRCLAAFERSRLAREGYFDNAYFKGLLERQTSGQGGYSFHLWTVLNAVLWHESWIEGRVDCF
jgi:asparagine synthase (glutamine-hydrolysing)